MRVLRRYPGFRVLLTGFAPAFVWAAGAVFAMQAVRGLGLAAIDVASNSLLQRLVPDALLGRGRGRGQGGGVRRVGAGDRPGLC